MKIKIGDFEVNITATQKYNKRATKYFLNEISIVLSEASKYNKSIGCEVYERIYQEMSEDIYNQLKESGYYKKEE